MMADHFGLLEGREIALQLHRVLSEIDSARWRNETAAVLKVRLAELLARIDRDAPHSKLGDALRAELPTLDAPPPELRSRWLAFKQRMQPAYLSLAAQLREASIHVPSLRPTNYARNVFHVGSAVLGAFTIELIPDAAVLLAVAAALAVFAWTCEFARRRSPTINALLMRVFGIVAHPHETHRVNSATWYATALVLLALTGSQQVCVAAVVVLGVGDPVAALIGRRFGRIKLIHGRSLEGTLAFTLSAAVASFVVLSLVHGVGSLPAGAFALSAATAGAIAELVSLRVDDNFSIPLSAAAGMTLASWALGVAV
jgi:dolichol kinase